MKISDSVFKLSVYFTLLLCSTNPLFAQNKDGKIQMPLTYNHDYIYISNIEINGNDKTKNRIILRELDFTIGDSLATMPTQKSFISMDTKRISINDTTSELSHIIRYSRENLINTNLFLTVDLILEQTHGKYYKLKINLKERWYVWALPVITVDAPNINEWLTDRNKDQLNKGIFFGHKNLWGLSHQIWTVAYGGSSMRLGMGYTIPWIGKGQRIGLSTAVDYQSNAVVEYGAIGNERQMLYDKNSSSTLALKSKLTMRPNLYTYTNIKLDVLYSQISDSLYSLSPNFLPDTAQSILTAELYLDYIYDSRNNKSYPLKGQYLKGFVKKTGLGFITHDVDYFFYGIDFHFYQTISKKLYVAEMVKAVSSTTDNLSYNYMLNMTSGDNFLRGYDHYALRGEKMYYFRGNVKYELIEPAVRRPKFASPDSKFLNIQYALYFNIFSDAGFVRNYEASKNKALQNVNPLNNKMLYSWGAGLDLVSYYNMVIRFEYVVTSENSHGFFIGFKAPI